MWEMVTEVSHILIYDISICSSSFHMYGVSCAGTTKQTMFASEIYIYIYIARPNSSIS